MKTLLSLLAVALVCLGQARAQDNSDIHQNHIKALKGVTTVKLLVHVDKTLQEYGLSEAEFYRSTSLRLTKIGITVQKADEGAKDSATPTFNVVLDGYKIPACVLVCHIQVCLCEPVRIERQPQAVVRVATWREELYGAVDSFEPRRLLMCTDGLVDHFVNDWTVANPGAGK